MLTQTIKDTLAPRETNGHVVFLKKLHWFKTESQVEVYVEKSFCIACLFRNEQTAPHASKQHALRLTAPPPASDSRLTSEDPACDTALMRPSHATTTPGNTPGANVANIKPIMTGDALVDSQLQNEGGGPAGEDSASESTEEDSYSNVEYLGLDLY
ncbi:hypothetical protein CGCF415_v004458 [Colletotrichum fructicola]|uniref:Uncharacterized protein n=1 Tax=Colletotrichum fructicola (strain Nara gc5) TaxID=1213859 RepID=L2GES8_COLFN|nr:hypothetical protein CGCFRS4_v002933 [Colletotrichum fructicola]KAF4911540.1 hypothetical protein CGCF415_v004458 [Colletotrichum fructicola]KAF4939211.1 hypothetical protein CGCF245_v003853 [Colletotrichum fructicola]